MDYDPDEPRDTHDSHAWDFETGVGVCRRCGVLDYHPASEAPCRAPSGPLRGVGVEQAEIELQRLVTDFFGYWRARAYEILLPTQGEWTANFFEWTLGRLEPQKYCKGCRQAKPLSSFHVSKAHSLGRQPRCRACRSSKTRPLGS